MIVKLSFLQRLFLTFAVAFVGMAAAGPVSAPASGDPPPPLPQARKMEREGRRSRRIYEMKAPLPVADNDASALEPEKHGRGRAKERDQLP